MDRIDVGLKAPKLNYQFWWGIRSLVTNGTNGNLGLLLASPQLPTQAIPSGCDNQPSPFLNIIAQIVKLGPLTDEEARELLQQTPQPFDDADKKWILKESRRWPALLQVLLDARLRAIDEMQSGGRLEKKEGLERIKNDGYLSNLYNHRNE
jgi:polyhydroxyalkanoate synthesis regulator phasin